MLVNLPLAPSANFQHCVLWLEGANVAQRTCPLASVTPLQLDKAPGCQLRWASATQPFAATSTAQLGSASGLAASQGTITANRLGAIMASVLRDRTSYPPTANKAWAKSSHLAGQTAV